MRPDPRRLHHVLLAVHAFLPIAKLYENMLEAEDELSRAPGFPERFRQIHETNRRGAEVLLEHAQPTDMGQGTAKLTGPCASRSSPPAPSHSARTQRCQSRASSRGSASKGGASMTSSPAWVTSSR